MRAPTIYSLPTALRVSFTTSVGSFILPSKSPPYSSVLLFERDRNEARVVKWAMCSSTKSKPAARARAAPSANWPEITAISSAFRSSTFCLQPVRATFRKWMSCKPIFRSGFTLRSSSTNSLSSSINRSSLTRRLKELREGSTTAASTTMEPTPPRAILLYRSLMFSVTWPSSAANLVTAAVSMILLGKIHSLMVRGEKRVG